MNISFWALSGLVNGITSTILGIIVYSKHRRSLPHIMYGLFCLSVAIWSYSYFFWQISSSRASALFWSRALMGGAIFIPIFYIHHIFALVGLQQAKKKILILGYIFAGIFFILDFTPFFVKDVNSKLWFSYWPEPGVVFPLFLSVWFWFIVYGLYIIISFLRKATGEEKNQLRYILAASIIGWVGGSTNFPLWFGLPFPPLGNILVSVYVALVAYAIVKYRLMDIKIAITRASIFVIVYAFVLGTLFIVLYYAQTGLISMYFAVYFALIIATAGPIAYRFLQKKADSIIMAQQRRYQQILLQAATGMVTEHNLDKLCRLIVYILKKAVKLSFAAVFIEDKKNNIYTLAAIRGEKDIKPHSVALAEDHPFIYYLKKNKNPFFFEEMPVYIKELLILPFGVKLIIPSFAENSLLAFVFLGEKTNAEPYVDEDMNVFKILSRQAALAIENCIFLEESRQTQERIFSAEKLASIGGMADGVAHQIKNRLNQFSVVSGELKYEVKDFISRHKELIEKDPGLQQTCEYLSKIADSLIDNVKKTDGIIKGILDFARVEEKETFFSDFSFKEIVDLSKELLMIKHETSHIPLKTDFKPEDTLFGIKSQLTEVIYNMLDNSFEAVQQKKVYLRQQGNTGFEPLIELRFKKTPSRYIIEISDNGLGIKEEDKHKIFAPFFTTKSSYKSGTGIGVYVVKRIIEENHHGRIWFTSSYLRGTEFFIELPKKN
ncbi:MAG: GHKL domain-containing protein [Candidatus Omnitrophica bacterium]|nr:GHKL domain-containing protein [Candidatus Omnitrophota bacterium]MBD3269158.1 GHKL domain-containing protein [Candidatus Omnitrophota bacterium]